MINEAINTVFIGKVAFCLNSVDSTNKYAHELISKINPIEGTVIRAEEQYAGRGQFGSEWESKPGENITISIILCPKFLLVKHQFYLNAAIALGVYDFVNELCPSAALSIKWPNDMYIGDKKVAGLLIENILRGIYLDKTIVGIGININQSVFDPNLPNPTSLCLETQKKFEINDLLLQLYAHLERQYFRLQKGSLTEILQDYHKCLFGTNLNRKYKLSDGSIIEAEIVGVEENGRLLVKHNQTIRSFDLKEISVLF
jgi:BirA family transcriptional regulator, biotin operon repressor / biotin---[acetyl-CoA-carboxylase] ligase